MSSPLPLPVSLRFSDAPSADGFRVFEVSPTILESMLAAAPSEPPSLEIRGEEGAQAVAVSSSLSYNLRLVENSNTLLLVDAKRSLGGKRTRDCEDGDEERGKRRRKEGVVVQNLGAELASSASSPLPAAAATASPSSSSAEANARGAAPPPPFTVHGSFSRVYELVETVPRLHTLRALLEQRPYSGPPAEVGVDSDVEEVGVAPEERPVPPVDLSFGSLQRRVQASDAEIRAGLAALHALEVDGQWRVLDEAYASEVFGAALLAVTACRWPLAAVPVRRMQEELEGEFPPAVVELCLRSHGEYSAEAGTVALSETAVCVFAARRIFASLPDVDAGEFEDQWADGVPYGFTPDTSMLRGVALLERHAAGDRWRFAPRERLPPSAEERFASLFRLRPRWEAADLAAYTVDLVPPGMTHDAFLLRHCRAVPAADGSGGGTEYISR